MSAAIRAAAFAILALLVLTFAWTAPTLGAEPPGTVVLVAKPGFKDPLYGAAILIAKPLADGRHVGFILNKPTKFSLAEAFPGHSPSMKVRERLYLGGPSQVNLIFALVQRPSSPGEGAVQLAPELFLAVSGDSVDRVIETEAEHARFFMGVVMWRPGELDQELKRGAWYVLAPDPQFVLPKKTEGLWEELVERARISADAI